MMKPTEGRQRVVIEEVQPQVNCGRYAARRFLGDQVEVRAAIFSDGHDHVAAELLYKREGEHAWHSTRMTALVNDMWVGHFPVDALGPWRFTIRAWVDHFDTWCADLRKRLAAQIQHTPPPPPPPRPPRPHQSEQRVTCRRRTFRSPSPSAPTCWTRPRRAPPVTT